MPRKAGAQSVHLSVCPSVPITNSRSRLTNVYSSYTLKSFGKQEDFEITWRYIAYKTLSIEVKVKFTNENVHNLCLFCSTTVTQCLLNNSDMHPRIWNYLTGMFTEWRQYVLYKPQNLRVKVSITADKCS